MSDFDDDEPIFPSFSILVFRLDQQLYALPLNTVAQIVDMVVITRLPELPAPLEGVIDVHGHVTPVIAMRARLGLPRREFELHTPLVLVELLGRPVALIVDDVLGVREVSSAELEVPESFLPASLGARTRYVTSVGKVDGELVLLLDPSQLLAPAEAEPLESVLNSQVSG